MLQILFLLTLLGAPPASSGPGASAPLSDAELRKVVITMERGMCYGECAVYEIRITGDGRISYHGKMFVETDRGKPYADDLAGGGPGARRRLREGPLFLHRPRFHLQ